MVAKRRAKPEQTKYGWVHMVSLTINLSIGTGILALPAAIGPTSSVLSVLLLFIAVCGNTIMSLCGNDAIARAYALRRGRSILSRADGDDGRIRLAPRTPQTPSYDSTALGAASAGDGPPSQLLQALQPPPPPLVVPDYSIPDDELMIQAEAIRVILGRGGFYFYQVVLIVLQVIGKWMALVVIAESLTSVIPLTPLPSFRASGATAWVCQSPCSGAAAYAPYCQQSYWIWACVCIVYIQVGMFYPIKQQKTLQMIFTFARILVVLLVIGASAVALGVSPYAAPAVAVRPPYASATVPLIDFDLYTIGHSFSVLTFSLMSQGAIPQLIHPVVNEQKRYLTRAVVVTNAVLLGLTVLVIFVCGEFFGSNSNALSTINFATWDGVLWGSATLERPWWASAFSYVVRLLPPAYTIFIIPVRGIILRDNILGFFPARLRTRMALVAPVSVAIVLAVFFLGGFARCLGDVLGYASMFSYVLILMPGILAFFGRRRCVQMFGRERGYHSPHSGWFTDDAVNWLIVAVIVASIPFDIAYLVKSRA